MRIAVLALALLTLNLPVHAAPRRVKDKPKELVVHLKTSNGTDAGTATFKETMGGKLHIKLALMNLPEGDHAVHIHQNPVCDAPDFKGAGGHFNPDKKQHGTKNPLGHHNGDLPENIVVGMDGKADASFTVDYLSLKADAPQLDPRQRRHLHHDPRQARRHDDRPHRQCRQTASPAASSPNPPPNKQPAGCPMSGGFTPDMGVIPQTLPTPTSLPPTNVVDKWLNCG